MKENIIKILISHGLHPEVAELTFDEIMDVIEDGPVINFDEDELF
jgi:hypothetical protein